MNRILAIAAVALVAVAAMAFAAANAGYTTAVALGFVTLYRVPVALVAFSGLFIGMLVMFATGIHTDLRVRRILRDRLAEESRKEQGWIDRNQRDLFADAGEEMSEPVPSVRQGPDPELTRGPVAGPAPAVGSKPGVQETPGSGHPSDPDLDRKAGGAPEADDPSWADDPPEADDPPGTDPDPRPEDGAMP